MINKIICHIDNSLKEISFINKCYGLAETVVNNEDQARKYPAIYKGKGNLERVEFEPGISYHRITGPIITNYLDNDSNGVIDPVSLIYPMVLIVCAERDKQTDIEIVQKLMFELSQVVYGPLKSKIKFQSIRLRLQPSNIDRFSVWNTETDGADPVNLDRALVAINYQLEITTFTNCLNNCQ